MSLALKKGDHSASLRNPSFKVDFEIYGTRQNMGFGGAFNSSKSGPLTKMDQNRDTVFPGSLNYSNVSEYQLEKLLGQGNYA